HNVAGFAVCDDGVVVDLSRMKEIAVDPEARTVRVGGGCNWAEVNDTLQPHGLAATGGFVSVTGVAGLTLGGGLGWLVRKHGLALDNLLSVDVVTADGKLLIASPSQNEDLLWGLRGGGGNFWRGHLVRVPGAPRGDGAGRLGAAPDLGGQRGPAILARLRAD